MTKLAKEWNGHKAGTHVIILGPGDDYRNGKAIVNGEPQKGPCWDAQKAETMRNHGFVAEAKAKKAKAKAGDK